MRNSPHLENISSFAITGLSTRTANSAERDSDTAKIPGLWQDFYAPTNERFFCNLSYIYFNILFTLYNLPIRI